MWKLDFSKIDFGDMHSGMGCENGPREVAMQTKIMQVSLECEYWGWV